MTRHYCTYFDKNYINRGLALYNSLEKHAGDFYLWALCMDKDTVKALSSYRLPRIRIVSLDEFELADPKLAGIKSTRTLLEYYFTCTPSFMLYVMSREKDIDLITYLDADIYFFSDPEPLFDEMGDRSIAIIEHRFSKEVANLKVLGIYNIGWVSIRRDETGMAALNRWREQCIEWCYDRAEDGKYADQKYLDDWPERYKGTVVLKNLGADVATWNLNNAPITVKNREVFVGNDRLIFFHFHGLRKITKFFFDTQCSHRISVTRIVKNHIYKPYLKVFDSITDTLLTDFRDYYQPSRPLPRSITIHISNIDQLARFLCLIYRFLLKGGMIFMMNLPKSSPLKPRAYKVKSSDPILTIFSCPKPFTGEIDLIQRNSIKSWRSLKPDTQVILIGNEKGMSEVSKKYSLTHVSDVETNQCGTPLISSIFKIGQDRASTPYVCYTNADIIFLDDIMSIIERAQTYFPDGRFLITGRRWKMNIKEEIDTSDAGWSDSFVSFVEKTGELDHCGALDYFIFSKGLFKDILPFAVGRPFWDNWIIYKARNMKVPIIDATNAVMVVHQNHPLGWSADYHGRGVESVANKKLVRFQNTFCSLYDSTHVANRVGINRASVSRRIYGFCIRWRAYFLFAISYDLYPWSLPILVILRSARRAASFISHAFMRFVHINKS